MSKISEVGKEWWATAPDDVREARLAKMKEGRIRYFAERRAEREFKVCCICGEKKPRLEFHRQRASADGRDARCKVCKSAYEKERKTKSRGSEYWSDRVYNGVRVVSPATAAVYRKQAQRQTRRSLLYTIKALLGFSSAV
jgi:hypothetical protein